MRDGVNMSSKTSEGDSGMATVGPTGDVKWKWSSARMTTEEEEEREGLRRLQN